MKHAAGMDISRRGIHEMIDFSNDNAYIQVIPMMKKILQENFVFKLWFT